MNCPVCGAVNEVGAAFCYRCGSALTSGGSQPPAMGRTVDLSRGQPEPTTDNLYAEPRDEARQDSFGSAPSESRLSPYGPEPGSGGARVYQVPAGNTPPPYVIGTPPAMGQTSNLAVFSLILGILGFVFLPFIAGIGAVITGHMARREVRGSGGRLTGDGMATAGLVLGYINVALSLLLIISICIFPLLFFGVSSSP